MVSCLLPLRVLASPQRIIHIARGIEQRAAAGLQLAALNVDIRLRGDNAEIVAGHQAAAAAGVLRLSLSGFRGLATPGEVDL